MGRMTRREVLAMGRDLSVGLAAGSMLPLAGCHHGGKPTGAQNPSLVLAPSALATGAGSLKAHATTANLLYGCAVDMKQLRTDEHYRLLVAEQSSILVPENAMKWDALRPTPELFDFADADFLVDFAEKSSIKLRGHCLVWHEALPKWFDGVVYRGNARQILTEHINTVAGRYAGRLHSWDVLNEAVDLKDQRADGLRVTPWLDMLGPEYIELAYKTARASDPNALLTYNDYGLEMDDTASEQKRMAVLVLLRRLKARDVPIDALGIQSHLTAEPLKGAPREYKGLRGFISEVRGMGLQVFLTEMDVSDRNLQGDDLERSHAVAQTYHNYLTVALNDPGVKAMLTWGISNRHTWLNSDKRFLRGDGHMQQPLPFDGDYRATPTFFAMRDVFDARGTAPMPVATDTPQQEANPYAPFTPHPGGELPAAKPVVPGPQVTPAAPAPPASTLPPMPTTGK